MEHFPSPDWIVNWVFWLQRDWSNLIQLSSNLTINSGRLWSSQRLSVQNSYNHSPFFISHSVQWLGYGTDIPAIADRFSAAALDLSLLQSAQNTSSIQRALYSMRSRVSSPAAKRLEREADHLYLPSTEVKNMWSYTPTSPYAFMACTGITLILISLPCHTS